MQMHLRPDDLFLSRKQIVRHKLRLHVLKSQPAYRVRETLPCVSLFTEQQDRFFQNGKHFLLIQEYLIQR